MGRKAAALATMMQSIATAALDNRPILVVFDDGENMQVQTYGSMQDTIPLLYVAYRLYKDVTTVPEGEVMQ